MAIAFLVTLLKVALYPLVKKMKFIEEDKNQNVEKHNVENQANAKWFLLRRNKSSQRVIMNSARQQLQCLTLHRE